MSQSRSKQKSIFDNLPPKRPFTLTLPEPHHHASINMPPRIIGSLIFKDLATSQQIQGIFAIHGSLLVFFEENNLKVSKVLDLTHSRLMFTSGFIIARDGKEYQIEFSDKQSQKKWLDVLKRICIMTNFHERYSTIKTIGRGNFSKVFLVESRADGKFYAAKAFTKSQIELGDEEALMPCLLSEIAILKDLDHPNIASLHEIHETENTIYLIMDHIQGRTLQELFSKSNFLQRYTEEEIMCLLYSILDSLAYLASKGIMHRDVKPANILIEKEGGVKIVDFGFATYINEREFILKICGSPGFLAPEVFEYDEKIPETKYNDRCDVFSAGCIFFRMLFERALYDGNNDNEIMEMNKNTEDLKDIYLLIRKELNNPNSPINKEGLNLLLELILTDPKKRISAIEALQHNYFKPLRVKSFRNNHFKTLLFDSSNNSTNDNIESTLRNNLNKKLQSLTGSNRSELSPVHKQNSLKTSYLVPEMYQKQDSQTTFFGTNNLIDASFVHSEYVASYQHLEQKRSLKEVRYVNKRSFGKTIVIDHIANKIEEVVNDGEALVFDHKKPHFYDRIKSGESDLDDLADEDCEVQKLVEKLSIQKPFQMKLRSVQYL